MTLFHALFLNPSASSPLPLSSPSLALLEATHLNLHVTQLLQVCRLMRREVWAHGGRDTLEQHLGGKIIIFIILTEHSLHEPMYLFLCMLSGADLVLSACRVPQVLAILWFHAGDLSLDRCISQVFFHLQVWDLAGDGI